MKKKELPTKVRRDVITSMTKEAASSLAVSYDLTDGTVEIHETDPDTLYLNRSYERQSGKDKIIALIKAVGSSVSFDAMTELRRSFDCLIAVDTNTKIVGGRRLSVTIACCLRQPLKSMPKEIGYVPLCGYVMLDVNPEVNPERMGWHLILKNHTDARRFNGLRLGFIVDSELGEVPAMNQRITPYYRKNILPTYATMIYASDAASDSLPNQMVRYCDTAAESVFKHFGGDISAIDHIRSDDDNCKGYAWFETRMA